MPSSSTESPEDSSAPSIAIAGGGIGGLVLALALRENLGVIPVVYEQAPEFADGVGGAIGMYPNGLRVIRDISPKLLEIIRGAGYPYVHRRWYRHDGTEVAVAREGVLAPSGRDDDELAPIGIRRWKLQRALCDACDAAGIPINFGKHVSAVGSALDGMGAELTFSDGTKTTASLVFGADGVKSKVRDAVIGAGSQEPEYTGVTCLMGSSSVPRPNRGICFPSSTSTKCHMCTYPTGPNETIFQIYFPTPVENPENWGTMSREDEKKEVSELADRLEKDGWADQFVQPLREATAGSVVRVGLRARDPISKWVKLAEGGSRTVLLGDAAHPPVPYIGQGAMMAIEDAGTIAYLLQNICVDDGRFNTKHFARAMALYEKIRIPRTGKILGKSKVLGKSQQDRADSVLYNWFREWSIWVQVLIHGTLPLMKPGAKYNYREDVDAMLLNEEDNGAAE
jgi:salicylate hydroxylase